MDTYTRPWPRSTPHSADEPAALRIYDTTLRDGTQREGISLSVDDKIRIAMRLDELGVAYIEGGWPGSNPKDVEFFSRARDLEWLHAPLTAFGATCPAGGNFEDDPNLRALLDSGAPVCTIVGKASLFHVREVLRTTADENLRMISDSVSYLVGEARSVVFDAEVANMAPDEHAPYVGRSAFAHKGGLHAAAMRRDPRSYQHVEPTTVGNTMRVVVSELAGRGSLLSKAEELGITIDDEAITRKVLDEVKRLEACGFSFEAAGASVAMMFKRSAPGYAPPFELIDTETSRGRWSTVGASPNIIEASWQALADGIEYGLWLGYDRDAAASRIENARSTCSRSRMRVSSV